MASIAGFSHQGYGGGPGPANHQAADKQVGTLTSVLQLLDERICDAEKLLGGIEERMDRIALEPTHPAEPGQPGVADAPATVEQRVNAACADVGQLNQRLTRLYNRLNALL